MKRTKRFTILLLALLLTLSLFPTAAWAADTATAYIPVEKLLTGDNPGTAAEFTFKLTPTDPAYPMPASDTLTITGAGEASFGPIEYTLPDDYTYTVEEQDDGLPRYEYDPAVYTVTVRVTNDDTGGLSAAVWMTVPGADGKADKATFSNRYTAPYDPPAPSTGNLTVKKTVVGSRDDKNKAFPFTVTFNAAGRYSYTGSASGSIASGDTVYLSHREAITILNLPSGASYAVTESDNAGFYVYTSGETGVIAADRTSVAAYTNSRSSTPPTGDSTQRVLWLSLLALSGAGMLLFILLGKKRKRPDTPGTSGKA